ncbi:Histone deacetylase 6 [Pelomyxa schiedti]|nr:Histone deacetylase 6 [Pelomyxa schiedti]
MGASQSTTTARSGSTGSKGTGTAAATGTAPRPPAETTVKSTSERIKEAVGTGDSPRVAARVAAAEAVVASFLMPPSDPDSPGDSAAPPPPSSSAAAAPAESAAASASSGGGREVADLARYGLRVAPRLHRARPSVVVVDLSYNRLNKEFPTHSFSHHMQELHMIYNHLQTSDTLPRALSHAHLTNLQVLDLSYNMIESVENIPFNEFTSLQRLGLRHNPLTSLPASICTLSALTELNAGETSIPKLPRDIGNLRNLRVFKMDFSEVSKLPSSMSSLQALEVLDFDHNRLSKVPELLFTLAGLRSLRLGGNQITEILDNLSHLAKLESLDLSPSNISAFPLVICKIASLRNLHFCGSTIPSIPDEICNLANLETLKLRWNKLTSLPDTLSRLGRLHTLDIAGNSFTKFPEVIPLIGALRSLNYSHNTPPFEPEIDAPLKALERITWLHSDHFLRTVPGPIAPNPLPPAIPSTPSKLKITEVPNATTLSAEQVRDKVFGTIFGAAIGDAIGLATEFMSAVQASFQYGGGPIEFAEFIRCRHRNRFAYGDWTDDTDQLILIMQQQLDLDGGIDLSAFGLSLLRWAYEGYADIGDFAGMGLGGTVGSVMMHMDFLKDPHKAAQEVWEQGGKKNAANGAVMRTGFLGIPFFYDTEHVVNNTLAYTRVTHADPRCSASTVAVTVAIAQLLRGICDISAITDTAFAEAAKFLESKDHEELKFHMNANVHQLQLDERNTIGYTYKAMGSAFYALREDDFEHALTAITLAAGDADTNGCVAGAVLGCKLGYSHLPTRWLMGMPHRTWLEAQINQICSKLL